MGRKVSSVETTQELHENMVLCKKSHESPKFPCVTFLHLLLANCLPNVHA